MLDRELTLYDQLLQFPVFQGLSRSELLTMAGNTKFGFQKTPPNKVFIKEGDPCTQLHFLIKGQLQLTTRNDSKSFSVVERLSAPWLLQPEALFGARPRYTSSVRTLDEAHFITLSKDEVLRLIDDFFIIRLNFLNLLSTLAQRHQHRPWRSCAGPLRQRVVRFLVDHCVHPAGEKQFHILMKQLAAEVNDSRLNVSRTLNLLQSEHLLTLRRGCIEVPMLEHLLM